MKPTTPGWAREYYLDRVLQFWFQDFKWRRIYCSHHKLFQWLITLTGKNLHLVSSLNLFSFSFQLLNLILTLSSVRALHPTYKLWSSPLTFFWINVIQQAFSQSYLSRFSRPWIILKALVWTLSNLSTYFLKWWHQNLLPNGQFTKWAGSLCRTDLSFSVFPTPTIFVSSANFASVFKNSFFHFIDKNIEKHWG